MEQFLKENNVTFVDGKIHIPETVNRVKLDIGLSYNAPHSQIWLKKERDSYVFGFEPVPENIERIRTGGPRKNPRHDEPLDVKFLDTRFKLIPCALSNVEPTTQKFYVTGRDSGCSSLFKPKEKFVGKIKEEVDVPVFSLKHFFDLFPWEQIPYIEYVKIDTQGSDLNVLKGAGKYLSERAVFVTAEADGYQYEGADEDNQGNIHRYMNSIGFVRVKHRFTRDPTFLNKKFLDKKNVFIYQKS
jgi:FkbM family methyltransferase